MMFNVPQFIDVEDKIAGPLTWRQLLWMIGMGALLLVLYNTIEKVLFVILAIPIILAFCALAFYRPQGQSLISFVGYGILFFFRPKVAVWERPVMRPKPIVRTKPKPTDTSNQIKGVSRDRLHELAQLLDRGN